MKQGKFIVFEGLDGSGKTTQLERLGARLTESWVQTPFTVPGSRATVPRGYCVNSSAKKAGLGAGDGSAAVCR